MKRQRVVSEIRLYGSQMSCTFPLQLHSLCILSIRSINRFELTVKRAMDAGSYRQIRSFHGTRNSKSRTFV